VSGFAFTIVASVRGPVAAAVVLLGGYLAAFFLLPVEWWRAHDIVRAFLTLSTLIGLYASVTVLSATVRWFEREVVTRARSRLGYALAPALRITIPLAGGILGLLILLGAVGIRSDPVNAWLAEHGGRTAFVLVLALVSLLAAEQAIPAMVSSAAIPRAGELEEEGIRMRESTLYLAPILAQKGTMTSRQPSKKEQEDIRFGWEIAKAIGRHEIGQCVVVKGRVLLAVEAIEGTDETIQRAGRLGGEGTVVIKVSKPNQDLRFDVPAVGPQTIDAMKSVRAAVLALEAGKTILLDKDEMLKKEEEAKISIVGVER